jgi:hypothetical protein
MNDGVSVPGILRALGEFKFGHADGEIVGGVNLITNFRLDVDFTMQGHGASPQVFPADFDIWPLVLPQFVDCAFAYYTVLYGASRREVLTGRC